MNLLGYPYLRFDTLSLVSSLVAVVFTFIIGLYSFSSLRGKVSLAYFYFLLLLSLITSCLVFLANNLIVLTTAWGFTAASLFALINIRPNDEANKSAKKTLIIVGATDSLLILGIGIIAYISNTFQMDSIQIPLGGMHWMLPSIAFFCLISASFAKAGVIPFHSWIPDVAASTPAPVSALLPACLDKLLGIYLLFRVSTSLFVMTQGMNTFLLAIGSITIVVAVLMALIQHDFKRLLGYHAVSQVGYMVLGIGTASTLGIAGGLFHMFNHVIYKSGLFLCSGNVQDSAKTTDLDSLGGLSKYMPVTFISCFVLALSISGVPPLNGFFSKWMIYQSIIDLGNTGSRLWVLWLGAAMFGSALTLASFMKIIHAVFLSRASEQVEKGQVKEAAFLQRTAVVLLAFLCILFGVFARKLVLEPFIIPIVGDFAAFGTWSPVLATFLIGFALIVGGLVFLILGVKKNFRTAPSVFIGGERVEDMGRLSGVDFYNSIKEFPLLKGFFKKEEAGALDVYELSKQKLAALSRGFQILHNGILPTYTVWMLLGTLALFLFLVIK